MNANAASKPSSRVAVRPRTAALATPKNPVAVKRKPKEEEKKIEPVKGSRPPTSKPIGKPAS